MAKWHPDALADTTTQAVTALQKYTHAPAGMWPVVSAYQGGWVLADEANAAIAALLAKRDALAAQLATARADAQNELIKMVSKAFWSVIEEHWDNGVWGDYGPMDAQTAYLRVQEKLPKAIAEQLFKGEA